MKLIRKEGAILEPIPEHPWESQAVLNPGTVREGDFVHMLYRAVEGENFSTLGYAKLDRSGKVIERMPEPAINRTRPEEKQGCEDARIVLFEGSYYIFYTAYDGTNVRVSAASTSDFKKYKKYGVIIPDVNNKDSMIFPQRIKNRIVLIHRVDPDIQFAYFDTLEGMLSGDVRYWERYMKKLDDYTVMRPKFEWEFKKIGAGAPPIKTDDGWLLIYHGVDKNLVYRGGAALLDLDDPSKVISRLPEPIIEPIRTYELVGDVPNVVFPEGTALFDDELMVYYGGADKVIGMANINIYELLDALKKHRQ
ncbi:hypothetical protein JXB12_04200 [candidate division KSB1 bacterium]|nr:hypothetical protein [candidate division KSB1 bacterium]